MECINVGKCAAGNKEIFSNIVDEVVSQKNIGSNKPTFIIAEIGQAHDGSLGMAYSFQKCKSVPVNKHDFKLNYIFTEQGIISSNQ